MRCGVQRRIHDRMECSRPASPIRRAHSRGHARNTRTPYDHFITQHESRICNALHMSCVCIPPLPTGVRERASGSGIVPYGVFPASLQSTAECTRQPAVIIPALALLVAITPSKQLDLIKRCQRPVWRPIAGRPSLGS